MAGGKEGKKGSRSLARTRKGGTYPLTLLRKKERRRAAEELGVNVQESRTEEEKKKRETSTFSWVEERKRGGTDRAVDAKKQDVGPEVRGGETTTFVS